VLKPLETQTKTHRTEEQEKKAQRDVGKQNQILYWNLETAHILMSILQEQRLCW
jgi:hypothetical protein